MRLNFFIALVILSLSASFLWYKKTENICPAPLHYRIGDINEAFALDEAEAQDKVLKAEAYWEKPIGRDLFIYDKEADFVINFVFDDRQETANHQQKVQSDLDKKRQESDEVREALDKLQKEYKNISDKYEDRKRNYETLLDTYNAEVNKYNDRGGAPEDVFAQLEEQRESLNKEANYLNQTAEELRDLAEEINKLGDRGNQMIDSYNEEVNQYNSMFGFENEFTQGDYQGREINIYKFSNETELLNVLAHEFGHSLGLGHVEDREALMYYLLDDEDKNITLSDSDLQAFYEVCGHEESFGQKVRSVIRELL